MQRRSLIKCILGIAAAPKILAEMEFNPPIVSQPLLTKSLFRDIQLLTPQYYKAYTEKYGGVNYALIMEEMGKIKPRENNYFWFENNNGKIELTNGNEAKSI